MRGVTFTAALALLTLAACVTEVPTAPAGIERERGNLTRLSSDEIRRLLVGRTLSFVAESGVPTSPHQEAYHSDGTMFVRVDRAGSPGTYTIADDRICLRFGATPEAPEECRSLFRTASGQLYLVALGDGEGGRPIMISVED